MTEEAQQKTVAILGYGTAGVNAAIALRTSGYTGKIVAFSNTGIAPYSPILTSYFAGGDKTYEECFPWSEAELASLDVDVKANCPVLELDPQAHTVSTPEGAFAYDKCVIATGATPHCLGFPGVDNDPAYQPIVLRTLDDAARLKTTLEDPACKKMLVSGASMVALKTVEACLNKGVQVTEVGMNPNLLDLNAVPASAERFERAMRDKGVELRLGQVIKEVHRIDDPAGFEGRKLQVTFSTGDVYTFDEISIAHGVRSNLGFIKEGSLEIDRALVVDEFMRTSDPDAYAAGDVAQALELVWGQKRVVGIWKNAAVQGQVAGCAIAAELAGREPSPEDAYEGSISNNTIAVNGTLFISAGIVQPAEKWDLDVREESDMTVVLAYQKLDDAEAGSQDVSTGCGLTGAAVDDVIATLKPGRRLVGFNITCDEDVAGNHAYDLGAMLTMRIRKDCER